MVWHNCIHEITHRPDREIISNQSRDAWGGNKDCRTSFKRRSYWDIGKNLDIIYTKEDLKQVTNNTTQLNAEERTEPLSLLEVFEDVFNGMLGNWDSEPVNL